MTLPCTINLSELDWYGVELRGATARPFCRISVGGVPLFVFTAPEDGQPVEFVFGADMLLEGLTVQKAVLNVTETEMRVQIPEPGTKGYLFMELASGMTVHFLTLTQEQAARCQVLCLDGQDHLVISPAAVHADGDTLRLSADTADDLWYDIYPPLPDSPRPEQGILAHCRVEPR